jgi:hypothetical protein
MGDDTSPARPGPTGAADDDQVVAERVQAPDESRAASVVSAARPARGRIRETLRRLPGGSEQVPVTEAQQSEVASINATTVMLDRSGAEQITAESVNMERSGAKEINTQSARLERSGVVALGTDSAELHHSSVVQVVAEDVRLEHSTAVVVSAQRATLEHTRVILFAGSADGDVRAVLTARAAAILAGGLTFGALLFSFLHGRSRSSS